MLTYTRNTDSVHSRIRKPCIYPLATHCSVLSLLCQAAKGTSIKDAIKAWEDKNGKKVADESCVKLLFQVPPIDKMDAGLAALKHVEQLSLSTNCIDKIANLNGFQNLRVLSVGRNYIKSLAGLEPVGDTLEELWISYNGIEKLKGCNVLKKCKVLYMSNNKVKEWKEFDLLKEMESLQDLLMLGNPLQEKHAENNEWLTQVATRLPKLKKLDGVPIVRADDGEEET